MPENIQEGPKSTTLKVSQLLLDDCNFRFPEDLRGASQKKLLEKLDREFTLLEIGQSLVDNGYFLEEPLVVIPSSNNNYIVVEGNRRLAALKLLLEKGLRSLAQNPSEWDDLAKRLKANLTEIPCVLYKKREQVTSVLGYRHIAGIVKWDPLAKARFINNLIEQKGKKADFKQIGREIGIRGDIIMKHYIAYRAYLEADDFLIDTSNLEKNFSIFYRAVTHYRDIARFIGLSKEKSPQKLRKPVPERKADALNELIEYVHGAGEVKQVIRESRQLKELDAVLAVKPALESLRITRDLQRAYELVGGEAHRLIDNLKSASIYLDEALKDVHRHKSDSTVRETVERCVQTMQQIAKNFPDMLSKLEGKK